MNTVIISFSNIAPVVLITLCAVIILIGSVAAIVEGISRLIVKNKP